MVDYTTLIERLRTLQAAATPGPYRAHDHNGMARVGADPNDWIGYGWVGRIKPTSGPNGEFDAGWLKTDRRKDGDKEYRARASADVHFVTETLNALPELLDALEALSQREARLEAILRKASDWIDNDNADRFGAAETSLWHKLLDEIEAALTEGGEK